MEVKNPGVKSNLLVSAFASLFPGCRFEWKNSQGIFNTVNRCMVKRSLCYSDRPVSMESSTIPSEFRTGLNRRAVVWGLCGVDSTRANKATDSTFILCNRIEKHFVAVAVVSFDQPEMKLAFFDTSKEYVETLLLTMKKEKEQYCEDKWERKRARYSGESSQGGKLSKRRHVTISETVSLMQEESESPESPNDSQAEEVPPVQKPELPVQQEAVIPDSQKVEPSEVAESVFPEQTESVIAETVNCESSPEWDVFPPSEEGDFLNDFSTSGIDAPISARSIQPAKPHVGLFEQSPIMKKLDEPYSPVFSPLSNPLATVDQSIDYYYYYSGEITH